MTPETIPWLFCASLCLLPGVIMVVVFWVLTTITNRHFTLDKTTRIDQDGIKHTTLELMRLTREDIKNRDRDLIEQKAASKQ